LPRGSRAVVVLWALWSCRGRCGRDAGSRGRCGRCVVVPRALWSCRGLARSLWSCAGGTMCALDGNVRAGGQNVRAVPVPPPSAGLEVPVRDEVAAAGRAFARSAHGSCPGEAARAARAVVTAHRAVAVGVRGRYYVRARRQRARRRSKRARRRSERARRQNVRARRTRARAAYPRHPHSPRGAGRRRRTLGRLVQ
jgi:hypothetical protein